VLGVVAWRSPLMGLDRQELNLPVALGPALMATRGYAAPEVEHTYTRARELCCQVEETPRLFPVLLQLRLFYLQGTEFQMAWELSEQCQSLAQRMQDPTRLLEAYQFVIPAPRTLPRSYSKPATRAQRYLAPSTATGFSVVYG
jgi:hypothetical protein